MSVRVKACSSSGSEESAVCPLYKTQKVKTWHKTLNKTRKVMREHPPSFEWFHSTNHEVRFKRYVAAQSYSIVQEEAYL
jgi:hypothetical protein